MIEFPTLLVQTITATNENMTENRFNVQQLDGNEQPFKQIIRKMCKIQIKNTIENITKEAKKGCYEEKWEIAILHIRNIQRHK